MQKALGSYYGGPGLFANVAFEIANGQPASGEFQKV